MDTRTPQEIEYDRLALSTRPTPAQPEAPIAEPLPPVPAVQTMEELAGVQINAWNEMNKHERLFATVVTYWHHNLAPTHQTMGLAGMVLLAAASDGAGAEDTDADEEEQIAAHIHRAAYHQGFQEGRDAAFKEIMAIVKDGQRAA